MTTEGSVAELPAKSATGVSEHDIKVSVVVAAYNSGRYIEPCIESLLGQTLPSTAYEVIFVDDGSTDGTAAKLEEVAARNGNVSAIHIPNSGWPGKPRNIGIDAAQGEYVYFIDHDDWLGPEALERMYSMAKRNEADIIIGKIAGHGRRVPPTLFRQSYEKCDLASAPLMESLTPHKGFRRAFLNEHGLRFPEGKRRLEDHVFVVEAYLRAKVVSVLADYTCYHHIARDDGQNAGFSPIEPVGYYANLREAIDVVERLTDPGELRNLILRRWYRVEMLRRVSGKPFLAQTPDQRMRVYTEVRRLALERFTDPGIWAPLEPQYRMASELLRADRFEDLLELAGFDASLGLHVAVERFEWRGASLRLDAVLTVRTAKSLPTVVVEGGRRIYQGPGENIPQAARLLSEGEPARADLQLRLRQGVVRHSVPMLLAVEEREGWERFRVSTEFHPASVGGRSLILGVWDLYIRLRGWGAGPDLTQRVGRDQSSESAPSAVAAIIGPPPLVVAPYWTVKDNLSLKVEDPAQNLAPPPAPRPRHPAQRLKDGLKAALRRGIWP